MAVFVPDRITRLARNWGWFIAAGIGYLIIGTLALSWPVGTTYGLTLALGILFWAAGVVSAIQAVTLRKESGSGWRVFHAIVALAAGLVMLRYPASGMLGVAVALAFYLFVSTAVKTTAGFGMRPHRGWGWMIASAVASFVLGVYIIATFPVSALWIPGLLLGIEFVVWGVSLIGLGFDLRRVRHLMSKEALPPEESRAA